jgi:hypothetical protein
MPHHPIPPRLDPYTILAVSKVILDAQHGLSLQLDEARLTGQPIDALQAQMRLVDDLYTAVNALPVVLLDLHPFQASVYAVTDHGASPTYLGTITTNAADAIEATTKAHTILWSQALDGAHPLTFATLIDQEHESPDKPDSFEAPPGAEP